MIILKCPAAWCGPITTPDDIDPVILARHMREHVQSHGWYGHEVIDRLLVVEVTSPTGRKVDLLYRTDRPLIGEEPQGGRRHAVGPSWVTLDGHAPALCTHRHTVRLVTYSTGEPIRATRWREPYALQPQCMACRHRLD